MGSIRKSSVLHINVLTCLELIQGDVYFLEQQQQAAVIILLSRFQHRGQRISFHPKPYSSSPSITWSMRRGEALCSKCPKKSTGVRCCHVGSEESFYFIVYFLKSSLCQQLRTIPTPVYSLFAQTSFLSNNSIKRNTPSTAAEGGYEL